MGSARQNISYLIQMDGGQCPPSIWKINYYKMKFVDTVLPVKRCVGAVKGGATLRDYFDLFMYLKNSLSGEITSESFSLKVFLYASMVFKK